MESEKVKEIKEKLQEEIFIANSFGDKLRKVPTKELENLLTLINELESENERLKWEKQILENNDTLLAKVGEMVQENQQLKDQIAELQEDKEKWQRKAINYYQMAKSYGIECIIDNDIDETLKEFIND